MAEQHVRLQIHSVERVKRFEKRIDEIVHPQFSKFDRGVRLRKAAVSVSGIVEKDYFRYLIPYFIAADKRCSERNERVGGLSRAVQYEHRDAFGGFLLARYDDRPHLNRHVVSQLNVELYDVHGLG